MSKQPHNGHESWNSWNVALWIGNDEPLYRAALKCIQRPRVNGKPVSAHLAALRFAREVMPNDARTPDGARYSHRSVKLALEGLMENDHV